MDYTRKGGIDMKGKRIGTFLIMILVVVSTLSAITVSATENMELPQQVIDISNGSDEIYGSGVPIEHIENPDGRFSSGGVDHTHQYIVSNALKILNNDKGESILNTKAALICEYTDWPDILGNETDYGTFSGHFYDPDTGKNWLGQKNPTARTRAEVYFQSAVAAYRDGYIDKAMEYLGKGTHYVSDLNEPHHASNLTAVNSNHSDFEKYVDQHRTEYSVPMNSFSSDVYNSAISMEVGDMLYNAAKEAKALADKAQNKNSYNIAADQSVQNAIKAVSKYIYKFSVEVGIYK